VRYTSANSSTRSVCLENMLVIVPSSSVRNLANSFAIGFSELGVASTPRTEHRAETEDSLSSYTRRSFRGAGVINIIVFVDVACDRVTDTDDASHLIYSFRQRRNNYLLLNVITCISLRLSMVTDGCVYDILS